MGKMGGGKGGSWGYGGGKYGMPPSKGGHMSEATPTHLPPGDDALGGSFVPRPSGGVGLPTPPRPPGQDQEMGQMHEDSAGCNGGASESDMKRPRLDYAQQGKGGGKAWGGKDDWNKSGKGQWGQQWGSNKGQDKSGKSSDWSGGKGTDKNDWNNSDWGKNAGGMNNESANDWGKNAGSKGMNNDSAGGKGGNFMGMGGKSDDWSKGAVDPLEAFNMEARGGWSGKGPSEDWSSKAGDDIGTNDTWQSGTDESVQDSWGKAGQDDTWSKGSKSDTGISADSWGGQATGEIRAKSGAMSTPSWLSSPPPEQVSTADVPASAAPHSKAAAPQLGGPGQMPQGMTARPPVPPPPPPAPRGGTAPGMYGPPSNGTQPGPLLQPSPHQALPSQAMPHMQQTVPPPQQALSGLGQQPQFGAATGPGPMAPSPAPALAPTPAPAAASMGPSVPVFLAAATRGIVPVSSRREPQQQQAPPSTTQPEPAKGGAAPDAEKKSADQNKQIAMQFLSADRDTQTLMLRDPGVARAILQTLGESTTGGKGAAAPAPASTGTAPAAALAPGTAPAGLPQMAAPALPAAPGAQVNPVPAALPAVPAVPAAPPIPKPPQWTGRMVLTRSMGKPLNTQATLVFGKVQLVELALRTAAGNGGVLNVSHRVPFDDLARRTPGAVLTFLPGAPQEHLPYGEYVKYFGSKVRAGVVKLNDVDALYIVPPVPEAAPLLKALEAAGTPTLATSVLLGVVAAAPSPPTQQGPPGGAAAAAISKSASAAAAAAPAPAKAGAPAPAPDADKEPEAKPEEEKKTDRSEAAPADAADAKTEKKETEADDGAKDAEAGDVGEDDGPEMSKDALLELFSNPELIKQLQSVEESAE